MACDEGGTPIFVDRSIFHRREDTVVQQRGKTVFNL